MRRGKLDAISSAHSNRAALKGDSSTTSALIPFAIDTVNPAIVLTPQLSLDLGNGAPVQILADPKGLRLLW